MLRVLSVYFPFTKATLKSEYFAYKSRFFLWALANCVSFLAQLFLWKAIYENSASLVINGYSFCEMVEYLGIAKIVECISFASIERKVSKGIRDGEIANSLIKPINYRTELLFCSFGQVIGSSCLFLPVYLISFAVFCLSNGVNVYISFKNVIFSIIYISMAFISHTAAEVVYQRADAEQPFMGLKSFRGDAPVMSDVGIAKNYLDEQELLVLNNLVSGYFDIAEIAAIEHRPMTMNDYIQQLDAVLSSGGRQLLQDSGSVSHEQALKKAKEEYRKYQTQTLSPVEEAYLETVRSLESTAKRKSREKKS